MSILTQVKENLQRFLTIPRFYGPLATIIFTIVYHWLVVTFGFIPAPGWLWLFMILGAFVGGRKAGLVSAVWVSLYAIYITPDGGASLTIQRVMIAFITVGLIGWQTHQIRKAYQDADQALNGNVEKMQKGLKYLREAKNEINDARHKIELAEDAYGNVMSVFIGFRALRKTMDEVRQAYGDTPKEK